MPLKLGIASPSYSGHIPEGSPTDHVAWLLERCVEYGLESLQWSGLPLAVRAAGLASHCPLGGRGPRTAQRQPIGALAETASCDDTKTCLSPYHAQVNINQNVTWSSTPFGSHIVSGDISLGPDGFFDFGMKVNEPSVFVFNQTGTYQYFDMILTSDMV